MNNKKLISDYLKDFLGKKGIISLDVGTITEDSSEWQVVESYCEPSVAQLHTLISESFTNGLKKFKANTPINYLYDYWKNKDSNLELVAYSFSINGYVKNIEELSSAERGSAIFGYKLVGKNVNKQNDETIDSTSLQRINLELVNITDKINIPQSRDSLELFITYQEIFTKMVLASFNTVLQENEHIKYVTIVLFRSFYDEAWHLSYNAAIFSNNISYLKDPTINLLFDYIRRGNYLNEIKRLKQNVRNESIKSAKAAIMSRNMSHNIGSHVMSYLKQHLGSVKDIVADGILSDLINGENELAKKLENTTENTTLPFLMGLGHFISYLQERQDFIATIATDYIPYFGNVNFKDAIYDELNPDKRAERHTERKNGKTDNVLLGNIARSEGLGRKTTISADNQPKETGLRDIVLKFRDSFDGNRVVDIDDSGNIKDIINQVAYNELEEMRRYDFSLPGGIVGRQAFFSIMENIIRNAAKHGNWREQKNLEFTFDIFSCKKEDINRLPSNDNVNAHCLSLKEVIERFYLNAKDAKDLYFVTITDNCNFTRVSKSGEVMLTGLGKLRNALTSNYINDSGEMENENKGLKEMRISAAWMRAIKDEAMCFSPYIHANENEGTKLLEFDKYDNDTDVWKTKNNKQKAPLLYARISAKKKKKGNKELVIGRNLQYIFCVQIPKKVAVILNNSEIEVQAINNNLERINWRAYTVEGFSKERNRSYEFILIDDECCDIKQTYFNIRSEATARTFLFSEINELNRNAFMKRLKEENYNGKDDLRLFYKSLANYQESDRILVDDKTAAIRNKDNNNVHITVDDGIDEAGIKYIYRRHHEAETEFTAFMTSKMKNSVEFVEGISGNNSTDRLIRNEELDESWFYRHLRAMKQQIAIFDERLFSKITGLEESDFNGSNVVLCKDNTALSFIQKGIYPFTLISDKTNSSIQLIGILFDKQPLFEDEIIRDDPQASVHSYKCKCGCIANIIFKNKELIPNYNDYGEYIKKHFHALTIHQGLLDKIYELFEIKGSEAEKSDKEIITNDLFRIFSCNSPIVLEKADETGYVNNKKFLPGLIIHSGRSKPNESDMPQKLPFIQYASLEHAVMDCKYSLVELLDFARYES